MGCPLFAMARVNFSRAQSSRRGAPQVVLVPQPGQHGVPGIIRSPHFLQIIILSLLAIEMNRLGRQIAFQNRKPV